MMNDEQLFTEAYRLNFASVEGYVRRRVSVDAVPDLVSEIFVVAWRRWPEAPRDRLLPWLYGVARLTLANAYRDGRRREALITSLAEMADERVEDHAVAVSERLAIAAAFDSLTPGDQEVLRLDVWEDLAARDAAVVLDCSVAAYHVRLHRARRRFKKSISSADAGKQRVAHTDEGRRPDWGTR
ncbi:sigma-70 family RNA polymerase sigma factor (plasmid) [Streptomyces sp. NBC_00868]|uniref:RNA polymerase sigma factor n=1 Tax=Streptomyces sp. NBC_00868 TaxID=2903683 RepID=UPI0038634778|nr:sigma-70 family RNA polymerase sigma factor [Streptomyces sp. NBC_00868]